jgi:hypothetical protein
VTRGEVAVKILKTREKREVAIVGVSLVEANTECFLARFQDFETFKRNPAVLRIHKLARPAGIEDLERLTLDANDISSLRDCRPGDCSMKLPTGTIEQLRQEVDWSSPDHAARAQTVFRERLFDYLERYLSEGTRRSSNTRTRASLYAWPKNSAHCSRLSLAWLRSPRPSMSTWLPIQRLR